VCATVAAQAGGIDRYSQNVDILFKDGNYVEVSYNNVSPSVTGNDLPQSPPGFPVTLDTGAKYSNVAHDYGTVGFGFKYDVSDSLALALIGGEEYGADILYGGDPAASMLAGTKAEANNYALSLVAKYIANENFSVYGGARADRANGTIALNGLAYGGPTLLNPATFQPVRLGASGYRVKFDDDIGYGYLVGAAYERPDIALRLNVTYYSKVPHEFGTTETLPFALAGVPNSAFSTTSASSDTNVDAPQAVNVNFQTGIAPNTLAFAGMRWVEWSQFKIKPEQLGRNLVELDNSTTWTLGLAYRFNPSFAASAAVLYEDGGSDDLVSPLAPTNGFTSIALGASYRWEQIELSGGIRYAWLAEAIPETGTPDVARAKFADNDAVAVGVKLGFYF
jgi:long-subunit fatty acid transport protein